MEGPIDNPPAERSFSQPANALAVMYGAAPAGREQAILRRAFDPPEGIEIIPTNALFAWKACEAMFEAGLDETAVRLMRDRFGAMLEAGSDTLWETWSPHASHCQGTGAGPAYLLCRYLAGVYPAEPGYGAIGIDPHPAGLDHLRSVLNTPFGRIDVHWQRDGDEIRYRLALPETLRDRSITKPNWVRLELVST